MACGVAGWRMALPDGRGCGRIIGRMAHGMGRCRMARGVAGWSTADQGLKNMARQVGMALPDGKRVGRHGMDLFGRRRPHGLMGRPAGPPRQLSARSHSLMHATRSHPVKSSGPAGGRDESGGGRVGRVGSGYGRREEASEGTCKK